MAGVIIAEMKVLLALVKLQRMSSMLTETTELMANQGEQDAYFPKAKRWHSFFQVVDGPLSVRPTHNQISSPEEKGVVGYGSMQLLHLISIEGPPPHAKGGLKNF